MLQKRNAMFGPYFAMGGSDAATTMPAQFIRHVFGVRGNGFLTSRLFSTHAMMNRFNCRDG